MPRPNFFIVGAPKCGTTALYQYLNAHPQIYMSEIKEPNYFQGKSRTTFQTEADYLALFAGATDEIRLGEASPSYLYSPEATEALHQFDPDAKIIIMLRDPVSLMVSSYWQHHLTGRESSPTFEAALAQQDQNGTDGVPRLQVYRALPLFTEHIQRYYDYFGRENVHMIIFDDLKQDVAGVYRQTLAFLGVDPTFQPAFQVVNARKQIRSQTLQRLLLATGINVSRLKRSPVAHRIGRLVPEALRTLPLGFARRFYLSEQPAPSIDPVLRGQLQAEFAPEVERLSRLLGRDLSHWLT